MKNGRLKNLSFLADLDDAVLRGPAALALEHGVDARAHRHRHGLLAAAETVR
jgi:hypothetical protein